jgi:hypothetical protein
MSEAERAVVEAEQRGRTAAAAEFGARLARSEFLAEAAKRNPGWDAAAVLEDLNLARYIGDDGEPDTKAISKAVERIVPLAADPVTAPVSLDLGTRSAPMALNGDPLEASLKQALGIR